MIVLSAQTHQGTAHNTAYKAKSCSVTEATEQLNLPSANCIAVTLRAPVGDEGWYRLGSKEGWWLLLVAVTRGRCVDGQWRNPQMLAFTGR